MRHYLLLEYNFISNLLITWKPSYVEGYILTKLRSSGDSGTAKDHVQLLRTMPIPGEHSGVTSHYYIKGN